MHDALNRVTAVSGTLFPNHTFTYDDQSRRLSKSVAGIALNYLYNGQDIVAEYQTRLTGARAHITHGPGTDEPLTISRNLRESKKGI